MQNYLSTHKRHTEELKITVEEILLVSLDLSAAFDTTDNQIFISTLKHDFRVVNTVLLWLTSYLTNRSQFIKVDKIYSPILPLSTGVPQESVFGSLLFVIYIHPLTKIFKKHHITFHQYVVDMILTSKFPYDNPQQAVKEISKRVFSVHTSQNLLKLNIDKTNAMFVII